MTAHVDPAAWARHCRIRNRVLIITAAVIVLSAAAYLLLSKSIIPSIKYKQAEAALERGDASEAIDLFGLLGNYKDANERASGAAFSQQSDPSIEPMLRAAQFGDIIEFGHYEQDAREENGKEPIRWIVFGRENGRLLLLSEYLLDSIQYNTENEPVTWESCTLREWLNGEFINEAFTEEERALVALTKIENRRNPVSGVRNGRATNDRAFVLSYYDFIHCAQEHDDFNLPSLYALDAVPTAYAKARGADMHRDYSSCCWWVRTPGTSQANVMIVDMGGSLLHTSRVDREGYGVRAALWVYCGD